MLTYIRQSMRFALLNIKTCMKPLNSRFLMHGTGLKSSLSKHPKNLLINLLRFRTHILKTNCKVTRARLLQKCFRIMAKATNIKKERSFPGSSLKHRWIYGNIKNLTSWKWSVRSMIRISCVSLKTELSWLTSMRPMRELFSKKWKKSLYQATGLFKISLFRKQ